MGAIKDLWHSERGIIAIVLVLSCTVLTSLGLIVADQWLVYTKWIFVSYVAGKTVTGTAAIIKRADPPSPASATASAFLPALLRSIVDSLAPPPPVASQSSPDPVPTAPDLAPAASPPVPPA